MLKEKTVQEKVATQDERALNLSVVREFMTLTGPERLERRNKLMAPGARCYLQDQPGGPGSSVDFFEWNRVACENFAKYGPARYDFYECSNPRKFVARVEGVGNRRDGTPAVLRYFFAFYVKEGRIHVFEENRDVLYGLYEKDGIGDYVYDEVNR